jgi:Na+/proline symporter
MLADDDGKLTSPVSPFTSILEEIMALGGFAKVAGTIAVTASLAAIMSTADSLIIAISQLVTVDLVYPLRPHASTIEMTLVGKGVSFVAVALSLLVGIYWDEGTNDAII